MSAVSMPTTTGCWPASEPWRAAPTCGSLLQTRQTGQPLHRLDLLSDDGKPNDVTSDFVKHIRRDRRILRRAQSLEPFAAPCAMPV